MRDLATAPHQAGFDVGATFYADVPTPQLPTIVDADSSTNVSLATNYGASSQTASKQASSRARVVFLPLREWEGTVTQVLDDAFVGAMIDLSEKEKGFQDVAEFPISDLPPDAEPLLKPGAIFRWSIGYMIVDGTRQRASKIVFRRLPAWTKRDLQEANKYASDLSESITWE